MLRSTETNTYIAPENFRILGADRFQEENRGIPPLLEGLGRVFVASVNKKKIAMSKAWIDSFGIVRGESLLPVKGMKVKGEEKAWEDAMLVSLDKAVCLVNQLDGDYGPETLVIGLDTVHFRQGVPRLNLSREPHLTGPQIRQEIDEAVELLRNPGVMLRWDCGATVSRQGLLASTGDSVVVCMDAIPPDLIKKYFNKKQNLVQSLNYNALLPIIDHADFKPYIHAIGIFPLTDITDRVTGKLHEWHLTCGTAMALQGDAGFEGLIEEARVAIVGGIPTAQSRRKLEQLSARSRFSGRLIV